MEVGNILLSQKILRISGYMKKRLVTFLSALIACMTLKKIMRESRYFDKRILA